MNYFRILRIALIAAVIAGRYTVQQGSEIAQRINREQQEYAGRWQG